MRHKILTIGLVAILALSLLAFYSYKNPGFPILNPTGISFQACNNHADGTQNCNGSVNVTLQDTAQSPISSVSLKGASGSFTYQGSPKSWSFTCSGTIAFGNGQSAPITASASGSGSPPSNWPISVAPKQWNLSTVYGTQYGQKNLTAQLGSKASPCSLAVSFNELPNPVVMDYRYASVAKWNVNYQAPSVSSSSSTTSSSASTSASSSQTSSTTTGGNTVTTSQTDIWGTTATAATNGATGNSASNGVLATLAPDKAVPSQSDVWAFLPPSFSSQCQGNLQYNCNAFINLITPTSSISETYHIGSIPSQGQWISALFSYALDTSGKTPYIVNIAFASSSSLNSTTTVFNQIVPLSPANDPLSPFDSQYQTWLSATSPTTASVSTIGTGTYYSYTTTVGTNSATTTSMVYGANTGCPFISPSKCVALSVISVTF